MIINLLGQLRSSASQYWGRKSLMYSFLFLTLRYKYWIWIIVWKFFSPLYSGNHCYTVRTSKLVNRKTTLKRHIWCFIKQIVLPIAIKPVTELNWSDYCYSVSHVYWSIKVLNLSLIVVFLFLSLLILTVHFHEILLLLLLLLWWWWWWWTILWPTTKVEHFFSNFYFYYSLLLSF